MSLKNICLAAGLLLATPLTAEPIPETALCFDAFGVGAVQDGTCLPLAGKKRRIGPADLAAALSDGVVNLKISAKTGDDAVLDLAPLAGAAGVHSLRLDRVVPVDLALLSGMPHLRALELKGDAALALSHLNAPMPSLVDLTLTAPMGRLDLSALAHMPNLRRLTIRAETLTGQVGLGALTRLDRARFHLGQESDFSALAGARALKRLEISGSMGRAAVTDLSFAAALTGLTHLDLSSNGVADLSPLSGLNALTYLALSDNGSLTDLAPLAGLAALETLHLAETAVTDLTPLAGLTGLRRLDLSQTPVTDISALEGLALTYLGLEGAQVN